MIKIKGVSCGHWVLGVNATSLSSLFFSAKRGEVPLTRFSVCNDDLQTTLAEFLTPDLAGSSGETFVEKRVHVVLSNHFCRYLVIPWSDVLLDSQNADIYLRKIFVDVYGDRLLDDEIISQEAGYGCSRLGCAVDAGLLRNLRGTCEQKKLNLASCRPYLDVAFEYFRRQIPTEEGVLALVENGILTTIEWSKNDVIDVDTQFFEGDWPTLLNAWCARNTLAEGKSSPVYIACPPFRLNEQSNKNNQQEWHFLEWSVQAKALLAENPNYALLACAL